MEKCIANLAALRLKIRIQNQIQAPSQPKRHSEPRVIVVKKHIPKTNIHPNPTILIFSVVTTH